MHQRGLLAAALLAALFAGPIARAQEGPPAPPPPPERDDTPAVIREKAYYVPFDELQKIFEQTGRGIFLPYEEFLRIWREGQIQVTQPDPMPPVDAVLRGGVFEGAVEGDVARLTVRYTIESLKKGWSTLALPLSGVAVEEASLSSPDALLEATPQGYVIHMPEPATCDLTLRLSVRVEKEPGRKRIRFALPRAAASRLDLRIPEEGVRVEVEPGLVVTQTAAQDGGTRVMAFLGNSAEVAVSWMPPPGKATEEGAIVFAQQSARVWLGERMLKLVSDIDFEVLRGEVDALEVRMPEEMRILSVKGDGLREWAPEGDVLKIKLHAPIKGTHRLQVAFERILDTTPERLTVPFPRALNVLRESGWVALSHDDGLVVRVAETRGLSQLDPDEVPQPLRDGLVAGFRYLAHPLAMTLAIEKIEPVVRAETVSVVALGREEDQWFGRIDYTIARAGLFRLSFRVATGWTVDSVGDGRTVEEFQTEDKDGARTVAVTLRSKAIGQFRLPFRLTREGTAEKDATTLAPPIVLEVEQDRGLFGVSAPRERELSTQAVARMVEADTDALVRTGILGELPGDVAMPRTFRYREQPASVDFVLKQKKTEVEVTAQHLVEVADGEIRVTHLLDYNVRYAPVAELRVRAPSSLDDELKVEAKQKTEVVRERGEGGETVWIVRFQPPVLGGVTLTATHAIDLKGLATGKPARYVVPLVHAADVRGEQGFVAIRKEGNLEIIPQPEGMEAIEAVDLPDKLRRGQVYSTYRYFGAQPVLALELVRYDYEQLATTIVQLLHLRSVMSPEHKLITQATLFVQNTGRQYLELDLGADARLFTVSVAGRTQSPKRRKDGAATLIQIPRSAGPGGTFTVVIVYERDLARGDMGSTGRIELAGPAVLEDVPVTKTELELYLPPSYVYMGFRGTLQRRERDEEGLWTRFKELLAGEAIGHSVYEGPQATDALRAHAEGEAIAVDLPTRGRVRYLFETLAPQGTLSFRYVSRPLYWLCDLLAFLLALLGGYALVRRARAQSSVALTVLCVGLALTWFARGAVLGLASSFLAGSALLCGGLLVSGTLVRVKAWSAARRRPADVAADPFLEDEGVTTLPTITVPPAAPVTPAPAVPASTEPAKTEGTGTEAGAGTGTGTSTEKSDKVEKPEAAKPDKPGKHDKKGKSGRHEGQG